MKTGFMILVIIGLSFSWLAVYGFFKLIDIIGKKVFKNWKNIT
jgi:hypothetical protein